MKKAYIIISAFYWGCSLSSIVNGPGETNNLIKSRYSYFGELTPVEYDSTASGFMHHVHEMGQFYSNIHIDSVIESGDSIALIGCILVDAGMNIDSNSCIEGFDLFLAKKKGDKYHVIDTLLKSGAKSFTVSVGKTEFKSKNTYLIVVPHKSSHHLVSVAIASKELMDYYN